MPDPYHDRKVLRSVVAPAVLPPVLFGAWNTGGKTAGATTERMVSCLT
jgi:hypothetical protein